MRLTAFLAKSSIAASVIAILSIAHYLIARTSPAASIVIAAISAGVFASCLVAAKILKQRSSRQASLLLSITLWGGIGYARGLANWYLTGHFSNDERGYSSLQSALGLHEDKNVLHCNAEP